MSFTGNAKTVNSGLPEMEEVRILMLFAFPVNEMITHAVLYCKRDHHAVPSARLLFLKFMTENCK